MNRDIKVASYGEILWDVFPDEKKIGGAPLNVALTMQKLGANVNMISAVGNDELGSLLIKAISDSIDVQFIQTSTELDTGVVKVILDENQSASYEICAPVAWDAILYTEKTEDILKQTDILVYGSLACRNDISKETLSRILTHENFLKVFDVNLRPPHYSKEIVLELMQKADFIKFNEEEIEEITKGMLLQNLTSVEEQIEFISGLTASNTICVTKGGSGAVLFHKGIFYYNEGYKVKVVDTVGAGDSFLATLILGLFKDIPPQEALDQACAVGAFVCSIEGANSDCSIEEMVKSVNSSKQV